MVPAAATVACGSQVNIFAADTSVFPFGTRMKIPGYGWGTVEDRVGAIRRNKIDLFFKTHGQALEWGRQRVRVEVVLPNGQHLKSRDFRCRAWFSVRITAHGFI